MAYSNSYDVIKAYNEISKYKYTYGKYFKTLFHLHTPASHDYKLFNEWTDKKYGHLNEKELFNICKERGLFLDNFDLKLTIIPGVNEHEYIDKKEAMSFLLLAYELAQNNFNIITLADHNTIDGYKKMMKAIENLKSLKGKQDDYYPTVILGVEISCADKNHVAAFFDSKEYNKLNQWLDESLVSREEGSFKTSLMVLEELNSEFNCIAYIAHMNTSRAFTSDEKKFVSVAYKKKLMESKYTNLIGIKDISKIEWMQNKIQEYNKNKKVNFLLDNDAHAIDEINQNVSWIKGVDTNYAMLKSAIMDYDVSVLLGNESLPVARSYIKGLYLDGKNAFLQSKNGNPFVLAFSEGLNCVIGGRGTGKSTIIEILEYILSQKCNSLDDLNFICSHGNMWILYVYEGKEYMVEMLNPYLGKDTYSGKRILEYFYGYISKREMIYKTNKFDSEQIKKYAYYNYLKIYKVIKENDAIKMSIVSNKKEMLNKFFDRTYSINELVSTASDKRINDFIFNTMFKNTKLKSSNTLVQFRSINGFKNSISSTKGFLYNRMMSVHNIIDPFNKKMEKKLSIKYTQDSQPTPPNFSYLLNIEFENKNHFYNGYNITNADIVDYLEYEFDIKGLFKFFDEMFCSLENDKYENKILAFITEFDINRGKYINTMISKDNYKKFLKEIYNIILSERNLKYFKQYLKECVNEIEDFTIEFNINTKSGDKNIVDFQDIKHLSLGQKVVAMLDFVLAYSEFSYDFRPLIIDQPEDNLDNRYIYENLVKELKKVKTNRQVIIATHNSTIVTNAMADLVIVMETKDGHGQVRKKGYPGEKFIKYEIVNCLEGGISSFNHKIQTYKEVLDE
ncbi:Spaf_1101 family AAA-like ATPase [Thomasclavelia cocleata]|uniref:Spaf_1101 family AAA-like ATPase n=1 Tax=Thomasclavelia cocleata TaxID=69824 RepID=UPI0024333404|nr:AAA family ATPase [Thomasclavelia cocleata]